MAVTCSDICRSCCSDRFDGCARCPAVEALSGGDVGVAGESADVDCGVAQGGHDLWPGSGADRGVVLTEGYVANPVEGVLDLPVPAQPDREQDRVGVAVS